MVRIPDWLDRARSGWQFTGATRPDFAVAPGPGQESVWDYPRPPRIQADGREVIVRAGTVQVARSLQAVRLLETASPPTFYLPRQDVDMQLLAKAGGGSICEWKGNATYWDVITPNGRLERVGWSYDAPFDGFEQLAGYLSFYPARMECLVDGVKVTPQPGSFYGGWVTPELVGPFKGEPGSSGW